MTGIHFMTVLNDSMLLCAHPVCLSAPWHSCWPMRNSCPCNKLCTCLYKKALSMRRRPPIEALSPSFPHQTGFCPSVGLLGGCDRTVWVSERAHGSAAAHAADFYCLYSHQHRRPGAGNMPPPIKSEKIQDIDVDFLSSHWVTWCLMNDI